MEKQSAFVSAVKKLEEHLAKLAITGTISIIVAGIAFYYNTTNTLQAHGKSLDSVMDQEKKHAVAISEIQVQVSSIEAHQNDSKEDIQEIKAELKTQSALMLEMIRSQKTIIKSMPE